MMMITALFDDSGADSDTNCKNGFLDVDVV